jgi:competence protein ComGC
MHDANLRSKNGFLLKEQRGLTIFELLGVLIILGIIATIIIPTVVGVVDKSEQDADTRTMENMGRIFEIWANQRDANGDCMLDLSQNGTSNQVSLNGDGTSVEGIPDFNGDNKSDWYGEGWCTHWGNVGGDTLFDGTGFNPRPKAALNGNIMILQTSLMVKLGLINAIPTRQTTGTPMTGEVRLKYLKGASVVASGRWVFHSVWSGK